MSSSFTGALVVEDKLDGNWVVVRSFYYDIGALGANRHVVIPEGFTTDFASIPKPLWNILPPNGCAYDRAAVVHDFLYRGGFITEFLPGEFELEPEIEVHHDPTRAEADSILNEAMTISGVGRLKRWLIYSGVRVGGSSAWSKGHK